MMITSKYISALLLQLYIIIFLCLNFYTCTVYNIMFIIVPMSSTFVFNLRTSTSTFIVLLCYSRIV